ncbi:hypothetical protein CRYUN_Cryun14cG0085500 [Craigia yunnanensis]
MLHELLLALVGYTGDLIIDERDHHKSLGIHLSPDDPISEQRSFKLATDISFIDPSERDLIKGLITLGFYYRELDRFAAKSRNLSWIRSADVSPLERASELSNPKTKKPSIYCRAIANGLVEILSVYRSSVLQIEQKLLSETMPILATVTQGLNKFFVILPPLFELILEIERDDIRGGQLLNLLHKRCHCGVPELQACIQRVLRNPSPTFQFQDAIYNQQIKKGSQKIHGSAGRVPFQKELFLDVKMIGEELFPQSEADKIETMLEDLKESSEFHKRSFECSVDSIRAVAASHLWQLVVVRANLNGHLKALKDYFLLEKGDFFQAAIKTTSEEDKYFSRVSLQMPSFGITMKSSQVDLPKTRKYTDGSSGSVLSNTSSETSLDGWDGIALEYSVDWPLHLFFTQEVLSKYRRIFQYLLRLKRTQMELEKSWASVMHQDHTDFAKHRNDRMNYSISQPRRQRFRPMWRVREHMAFLIRNLQFYIQVLDTIEFKSCVCKIFPEIFYQRMQGLLIYVLGIVNELSICGLG